LAVPNFNFFGSNLSFFAVPNFSFLVVLYLSFLAIANLSFLKTLIWFTALSVHTLMHTLIKQKFEKYLIVFEEIVPLILINVPDPFQISLSSCRAKC
jgi:hypothetical protein